MTSSFFYRLYRWENWLMIPVCAGENWLVFRVCTGESWIVFPVIHWRVCIVSWHPFICSMTSRCTWLTFNHTSPFFLPEIQVEFNQERLNFNIMSLPNNRTIKELCKLNHIPNSRLSFVLDCRIINTCWLVQTLLQVWYHSLPPEKNETKTY